MRSWEFCKKYWTWLNSEFTNSELSRYETKQQLHVNKTCFNLYYYWLTSFGHFCDHHHGVTQEYKQYANCCLYIVCILYLYIFVLFVSSGQVIGRRRNLYLATQNTHKRDIHAPRGIRTPSVPVSGRLQTHALDQAATWISTDTVTALLKA
jgi:hypothetical protein